MTDSDVTDAQWSVANKDSILSTRPVLPWIHPYSVTHCLALSPMPFRAVVVHADQSGVRALPVIAVEARLVSHFKGQNPNHARPTPELLMQKGMWSYERTEIRHDPVVLTPDGLIKHATELDGPGTARRLVACPWNPSEDEGRLAKVVAEVEAEAGDRAGELAGPAVTEEDADGGEEGRRPDESTFAESAVP